MRYVVGFLFNRRDRQVALIRKQRPEWQAGKLNGIGGKVEGMETAIRAMEREFWEEAGANIQNWEQFCCMTGQSDPRVPENPGMWTVHFFRAFTDTPLSKLVSTQEDEEVVVLDYYLLLAEAMIGSVPLETLPNLTWLIPMALHMDLDRAERFDITEVYE